MNLPPSFDGLVEIGLFVAGTVVSMAVAYANLSKKLEFMKGQLSLLVRFAEEMDRMKINMAEMNVALMKTRYDVDAAHEKIREISPLPNANSRR